LIDNIQVCDEAESLRSEYLAALDAHEKSSLALAPSETGDRRTVAAR
jgi:hypothetical protein